MSNIDTYKPVSHVENNNKDFITESYKPLSNIDNYKPINNVENYSVNPDVDKILNELKSRNGNNIVNPGSYIDSYNISSNAQDIRRSSYKNLEPQALYGNVNNNLSDFKRTSANKFETFTQNKTFGGITDNYGLKNTGNFGDSLSNNTNNQGRSLEVEKILQKYNIKSSSNRNSFLNQPVGSNYR